VKYTGADIPALGISYGDTLLHVEEQLAKFIISTLDGTGIVIDVPQSVICDLIKKHLPTCPSYQLDELIITLIKAICDLQTQVTAIKADITALNADYTIGCLTGVTASSDTHQIVQAIITKLCSLDTGLTALILNVNTNYVKIADINSYIAAYLATLAPANKAYTKMVPYVAMPYFGQLSNYPATGDALSLTGAGIGYWEKIYLCNGLNFTPDLRGRSTVGTTDGTMGGPTMDTNVIPSAFNPSYSLGTKQGTNSISLTTAQIPAHNHSAANSATGITRTITGTSSQSEAPNGSPVYPTFNSTQGLGTAFTNPSGLTVTLTDPTHTHTISDTGGGQPHSNNQPMMGAYYIMYIP
jgi:microcystin-dependent protein